MAKRLPASPTCRAIRLRKDAGRFGDGLGGEVNNSMGEVLLARRRNTATLGTGQVPRIDRQVISAGIGNMLLGRQVTDLATGKPVLWSRSGHFDRWSLAYRASARTARHSVDAFAWAFSVRLLVLWPLPLRSCSGSVAGDR